VSIITLTLDTMNKTIIEYIPLFIDYCREKGLSERTQENYKRFLNSFINWLKKNNLQELKPHELSPDHVWQYRVFLARQYFLSTKEKTLKKSTQNYYLIALRSLLSYFAEKDILSLPADKIALIGGHKDDVVKKYLSDEQIKLLIDAPDINTIIGLRDRIILDLMIYGGFKINQILKLNTNDIKNLACLSPKSSHLISQYLKRIGSKENKSLFVNYRGPKNTLNNRLTARGVEKKLHRYEKIVGLPLLITPEILRWSYHIELLNKNIDIKYPILHKEINISEFNYHNICENIPEKSDNIGANNSNWNSVENFLNKEIVWLKQSISLLPDGYRKNPPFIQCDNCLFRKIATLLIGGVIKATDITVNKALLNDSLPVKKHFHGKEWHGKLLAELYNYFKKAGLKVETEPVINYGRADLGFYDEISKRNVYIEIGTVSLYKVWYNLASMNNIIILLIPSESKIIKFEKI